MSSEQTPTSGNQRGSAIPYLAHELTLSFGRSKEDNAPKDETLTVNEFLQRLHKPRVGKKDGPYTLQGSTGGKRRASKNMERNSLLMFDIENGDDLDYIRGQLEAAGLFSVVYPTHSHLATSQTISEDAFDKRRSGLNGSGGDNVAVARDYMAAIKKWRPWLVQSIVSAVRQRTDDGAVYVITHAPMPRYRVVLFLEKPFDFFTEGGTVTRRVSIWKMKYLAVAEQLGLVVDVTCADPAKLLYLPSCAPGVATGGREPLCLRGNLLDFDGVIPDAFFESRTGGSAGFVPATKNLFKFLTTYSRSFDAVAFFEDDREPRHRYDDHHCDFPCPNESSHTDQKPDNRGFSVWSGTPERDFSIVCLHATCSDETGKSDRAKLLDAECQNRGIEDAAALLQWCPGHEDDDLVAEATELILDPKAPMPSAQKLIARYYTCDGLRTLHHDGADFLKYVGPHYERLSESRIKAELWNHLDKAVQPSKKGSEGERFEPTSHKVSNVLAATTAVAMFPSQIDLPAWFPCHEDMPPPDEIIPCTNGLLHAPTRRLLRATPAFVNVNVLPYAFDAQAPKPVEWCKFLHSLWGDDRETIETLQEMFGLMLTPDTGHQKIFLINGPMRSGKGTIGRMLRSLVGAHNTAGPTLDSLTKQFGLAPLIDKRLALISDARLGGRADSSTAAEQLLRVSGEDAVTVDRKNMTAWHGKLAARFVLLTNEVPRIPDSSGALASRFLILTCTESFLGREDHGLTERLAGEMPSILNWSLEGLDRLRKRGRFIQPAASAEALHVIEDLGSPIRTFIRECCVIGPDESAERTELYNAYCNWATSQGLRCSSIATFGRDLNAAQPGLKRSRPGARGSRENLYSGIGITPSLDDLI